MTHPDAEELMDAPVRTNDPEITAQIALPGIRHLEEEGETTIWALVDGERVGLRLLADESVTREYP